MVRPSRRSRSPLGRLALALVLFCASCEGKPASPGDVGSSARPPSAAPAASSGAQPASSAQPPAPSASAAASASAPAADPLELPKLVGEDGKTLPQTKDRPSIESPAFKKRMELLWQAIVANDATIAERSFFPVLAYELVKDIEKPKSDWTHRLIKNFARDVGEYHKLLGPEPKAATFIGVEIDDDRAKWTDPGKEGNKLGYYRVTRSRIRYRDAAGTEKKLELTSLISWRGEWFVVHLHGFK